jgi:hypothetical protein
VTSNRVHNIQSMSSRPACRECLPLRSEILPKPLCARPRKRTDLSKQLGGKKHQSKQVARAICEQMTSSFTTSLNTKYYEVKSAMGIGLQGQSMEYFHFKTNAPPRNKNATFRIWLDIQNTSFESLRAVTSSLRWLKSKQDTQPRSYLMLL